MHIFVLVLLSFSAWVEVGAWDDYTIYIDSQSVSQVEDFIAATAEFRNYKDNSADAAMFFLSKEACNQRASTLHLTDVRGNLIESTDFIFGGSTNAAHIALFLCYNID